MKQDHKPHLRYYNGAWHCYDNYYKCVGVDPNLFKAFVLWTYEMEHYGFL